MNNWKTTAQGLLSAFVATIGPLTAFLASLQAAKAAPDYTLVYIGAALTCAGAIAKAWIGVLQNDAQPVQAITPFTYMSSPPAGIAAGSKSANSASSTAKLGVWALISILGLGTLSGMAIAPVTGCTPATVEKEVATLTSEIAGLVAVGAPGSAWAKDLALAQQNLAAAYSLWVKGGAVQDMINVLNEINFTIQTIDPNSEYATLAAIITAGADALLAVFLPNPPTTAVVSHAVQGGANYHNRLKVTNAAQSRMLWSAAVAANPKLAGAVLK